MFWLLKLLGLLNFIFYVIVVVIIILDLMEIKHKYVKEVNLASDKLVTFLWKLWINIPNKYKTFLLLIYPIFVSIILSILWHLYFEYFFHSFVY